MVWKVIVPTFLENYTKLNQEMKYLRMRETEEDFFVIIHMQNDY